METLKHISAHYDGRCIVPDEPLHLPVGSRITVNIEHPSRKQGPTKRRPQLISEWIAEQAPQESGLPTDFSSEHDHYLYGTPKRNGR